jgi:hypothetical protein
MSVIEPPILWLIVIHVAAQITAVSYLESLTSFWLLMLALKVLRPNIGFFGKVFKNCALHLSCNT